MHAAAGLSLHRLRDSIYVQHRVRTGRDIARGWQLSVRALPGRRLQRLVPPTINGNHRVRTGCDIALAWGP